MLTYSDVCLLTLTYADVTRNPVFPGRSTHVLGAPVFFPPGAAGLWASVGAVWYVPVPRHARVDVSSRCCRHQRAIQVSLKAAYTSSAYGYSRCCRHERAIEVCLKETAAKARELSPLFVLLLNTALIQP
jgi:hypothetical protein